MFADDPLLFGQATPLEASTIMKILKQYEQALASGQKVNLQKSSVSFSPNVSQAEKASILQILEMNEVGEHGKYLGLPATVGQSKQEVFSSIKNRVRGKLQGVLIKSVLQAIPMYAMQCFKLPNVLSNDLNRMAEDLFWGSTPTNKKIHWRSWKSLCNEKESGGLGFRECKAYNMALLCKQAWKIVVNPLSPVAQMLKLKYFPDATFWTAELGYKPSYTWVSLLGARTLLQKGTIWKIGNGASIRIWGANCYLCNLEAEDGLYLFLLCPFTQEICQLLGIQPFPEEISDIYQNLSPE
ncbi:hypothetical protein LIER_34279 [Lithospermum erythrorhizon]|uniref:Reverse transcriptase zinc-binding domain-containing protein n=1 Tax=Lithospermum erythrorhizon TaxID=34254 RepID=A0AAV3S3F5_LITER